MNVVNNSDFKHEESDEEGRLVRDNSGGSPLSIADNYDKLTMGLKLDAMRVLMLAFHRSHEKNRVRAFDDKTRKAKHVTMKAGQYLPDAPKRLVGISDHVSTRSASSGRHREVEARLEEKDYLRTDKADGGSDGGKMSSGKSSSASSRSEGGIKKERKTSKKRSDSRKRREEKLAEKRRLFESIDNARRPSHEKHPNTSGLDVVATPSKDTQFQNSTGMFMTGAAAKKSKSPAAPPENKNFRASQTKIYAANRQLSTDSVDSEWSRDEKTGQRKER